MISSLVYEGDQSTGDCRLRIKLPGRLKELESVAVYPEMQLTSEAMSMKPEKHFEVEGGEFQRRLFFMFIAHMFYRFFMTLRQLIFRFTVRRWFQIGRVCQVKRICVHFLKFDLIFV